MVSRLCRVFLALAVLTAGCGTKTDTATGMRTTSSGLSCDEAAVTIDGAGLTSNEIPMGKKIVLRFTGVRGFRKVNGAVFPGATMSVTGPDGAPVGEFGDLFSRYTETGMHPKKAGRIALSLTTGKPMKTRAEYVWKTLVWDKKGKGRIMSEMKIKMI